MMKILRRFAKIVTHLIDYTVFFWSLLIIVAFFVFSFLLIEVFNFTPTSRLTQILFWMVSFDVPLILFFVVNQNLEFERKRKILYFVNFFIAISIIGYQTLSPGDYSLILYFFGSHIAIDQLLNYDKLKSLSSHWDW